MPVEVAVLFLRNYARILGLGFRQAKRLDSHKSRVALQFGSIHVAGWTDLRPAEQEGSGEVREVWRTTCMRGDGHFDQDTKWQKQSSRYWPFIPTKRIECL